MKLTNPKAQAWYLAAAWADQAQEHDLDVSANVRQHLLRVVVPSLRRKAEIVERNSKQGVRARSGKGG